MVIEIKKGTSKKTVKEVLKKAGRKQPGASALDVFFGKLPNIEDGLSFQKKVRRDWK